MFILYTYVYILCIYYVYIMYILCIYYVYIMYILCIYYVYIMYILCVYIYIHVRVFHATRNYDATIGYTYMGSIYQPDG